MTATSGRFSLSSLFLVAVAIAAYLSGRLKEDEYARGIRIAEADAAGLRQRSRSFEQLARTWKSIALDSRTLAERDGEHFRRWSINTMSLRGPEYTAMLDSLGIQLLTISHAHQLNVLSNFSSNLCITSVDRLPDRGSILQASNREQELVEQLQFRETPADVLLLLPPSLVEELAAEERAGAQRRGLTVSQIEETTFAIVSSHQARSIVVRSIRPISSVIGAQ